MPPTLPRSTGGRETAISGFGAPGRLCVYPLCSVFPLYSFAFVNGFFTYFKYFFILIISIILIYSQFILFKAQAEGVLVLYIVFLCIWGPAAQGPKPGNRGSGASSGRE